MRLVISFGLEKDESEQTLLSQGLALAYGHVPPLYTWLQWGFFKILGVGVASLAALKACLYYLLFHGAYASAKALGMEEKRAALASASLFLLPQIGWEAQRDLSHTLLATALASQMLAFFLRFSERPEKAGFLLPGLLLGLGVLAKYNFVFFTAGLLASCLTLPAFRSWLLKPRGGLGALVLAALVAAPHFWAFLHQKGAQASFLQEISAHGSQPFLTLFSLGQAVLSFAAFFAVVFLAFFGPPKKTALSPGGKLLARSLPLSLLFLALASFFLGLETVKDRWLTPTFFSLPLLAFACIGEKSGRERPYGIFLLAVILCFFTGLAGRALFSDLRGKYDELNYPMESVAAALARSGFTEGTVVCDHARLCGPLRLYFPKAVFYAPHPGLKPPQKDIKVLLWQGDGPMPSAIKPFFEPLAQKMPPMPVVRIKAKMRYSKKAMFTVSYALLAP